MFHCVSGRIDVDADLQWWAIGTVRKGEKGQLEAALGEHCVIAAISDFL